MTYPQQGYPPAPASQQPQYPAQQGYAPQQGYPPAQPQAPQYPPQQGYAPQQPQYPAQTQYPAQQGYPPQQPYGAPQQPAPQGPPPVAGTLDAFWSQPATGWGKAWSINAQTPIGTQFAGIVARPLTDADVEHQTKYQSTELDYFRDGRPKMVMKVPMLVQPSAEHPDGRAQFYVKGADTTELVRAMNEAGAQGEPEEGATIYVTVAGKRPNRSGTMSTTLAITYVRPQGAAPAQQAAAPAAPAAPTQQAPPPAVQPPAAPAAPPAPPQQAYTPPAPPQAPAQQAPPPVPPQAPTAVPAEIANDPARAQLLQELLNQQQAGGQPAPQYPAPVG